MDYIQGDILTEEGFIKGHIAFDSDDELSIKRGSSPQKPLVRGLIVPSFVNSHTHIGDSFIKDKKIELPKNVEDLVAPPNGLKHKLLRTASKEELINGMEKSILDMIEKGTSCFCDFRENGVNGISLLKTALKNKKKIRPIILSRPLELIYDKDEINQLLSISQGVGLSSISDWEYSEIEKIAKNAKRKGKIVSLHASEVFREDIDLILDLKPDFLIHMIKATESDLLRLKEENIPVVICPRSNSYYNLKIDLKLMKKIGITLMLGTDNSMLNSPNVLDELKFILKLSKIFNLEELLKMITITPRKVLNLVDCISGPNLLGNFVVLEKDSLNPIYIKNQR